MAPVLARAHHNGDDKGVREAFLFLGKFVLASSAVVLLLGLLMLLKNGLAPTDVVRLDVQEPGSSSAFDLPDGEGMERLKYCKAPSDL